MKPTDDELQLIDGDSKPDAKFNFVGNFFMAQMMVFQALAAASPNAYFAVKGFQSMLIGWADKSTAYKLAQEGIVKKYEERIAAAKKVSEGFKRKEMIDEARLLYATETFDELMRHVVFPHIIGHEHTIMAAVDYDLVKSIRSG